MTRVAVLGCGRIARVQHLDLLAGMTGVEIAAVADRDEGLRRDAARRAPGARACADYREPLADESVAAVVVCLPSGLHAEAARAAFAAGKDVYLEKPVATTAVDAAAVVEAWRTSGRIGMMGFNHRYHPAVRRARDVIRSGGVGRVIGARLASGSRSRDLPGWKRSRSEGGGVLLDLGSHQADLARFLFDDEVREVDARTRSIATEDDVAWMTLTLESGLTVESRVSLTSARENRFEVVGDAGRLVVDRIEGRLEVHPVEPPWGRVARLRRELGRLRRGMSAALAPATDPSYRNALAAFLDAVRRRAPIAPDPVDGERSLAVVLAAETAAREGRRIRVPALA